jgi:hypothetical protein
MERDRSSIQRATDGEAAAPGAPGRRTRVEATYPTLARKLEGDASAAPTIDDAATAAVAHKDAGASVDDGVAARVGAHLGADFSGVRVHSDPLAQEASAAIGARAFAHGGDVFLARGESPTDLGLMAHELTHVAQQGAAGRRAPQRKVEVGAADSPAEHEADAVATAVTRGAAPAQLLVDDGPVAPGQMLKSTFIAQLRAAVTVAADAELGPVYSAIGCPYIDQYFGRYADRPAADGEALLRRFAPGVRGAPDAAAMIPVVVERVRLGVQQWRDTGQVPPDLAAAEPAAAAAAATSPGAAALRAPDGRETLASLEADLGPGQALDGATASRMADALGTDVGAVRLHTGPAAAAKAAAVDALAFTVGTNVVLGAAAPTAGSLEGDALLAHELAHAAQQADAARDPVARRQPIAAEAADAEHAADAHVAAAVTARDGKRGLVDRLLDATRTGLQLQRCPSRPTAAPLPNDLMRGTALPSAAAAADVGRELNPGVAIDPLTGTAAAFQDQIVVAGTPHTYREDLERKLDEVRAWMHTDAQAHLAQTRIPMSRFDGVGAEAKRQTDSLFGDYASGPALTSTGPNPNLIDRSAQPPDAADLVRYLISNQSELLPVHAAHSAVPSRPAEDAIIQQIIATYSAAHRAELDIIDRAWPGIAGGGVVQIQPFTPPGDDALRRTMWDSFQTLIHEYLHTITHPHFSATAGSLGGMQESVLEEGFTSLFTDKVWTQLHPATIQSDARLRQNVEGRAYPNDPVTVGLVPPIRHYDQIAQARNIESRVGVENVRAAYFRGHVELLGLGSTYTAQAAAQGHRYSVPSGVTTIAEVARRTGATEAAIQNANGLAPGTHLSPGQLLDVPGIRIHLVRGDGTETKAEIARTNGVSQSMIERANPGTTWTALTSGQSIVIPIH